MEIYVKREKGITLIALVITIIILLILAGIVIATLSGENGILTRASEAREKTKKAEYKETLELIGTSIRPEQVMKNLNSKEYLDRYEEEIQKEINQGGLFEGATKERKNDETIWVETKEGWIYQITEKEVVYLGNRTENPEPPNIESLGIIFTNDPDDWTKDNVKVKITTTAERFSLQYAKEEPEDEISWRDYDKNIGVVMTENGDIYARLINNFGEKSAWVRGEVSKIDRIAPILNIKTGAVTSSSIVINADASDAESGIPTENAYQYYLNGTHVPTATGSNCTFNNLQPGTTYTIKVIVYDNAKNPTEQTITCTTSVPTIADLKGRFDFEHNNKSK